MKPEKRVVLFSLIDVSLSCLLKLSFVSGLTRCFSLPSLALADKYFGTKLLTFTVTFVVFVSLSTDDMAEEFKKKAVAFSRTLRGLEDRAGKCESLKWMVS